MGKITPSEKIATSAPIILGQFIRGDLLSESRLLMSDVVGICATNRTERLFASIRSLRVASNNPALTPQPEEEQQKQATPGLIDAAMAEF